MRGLLIDLENAVRLVCAKDSFLAAETEHMRMLNSTPATPFGAAERASAVRRAFFRSALLVAIAFGVGIICAQGVSFAGYAMIPTWQLRLQALGGAILLWATLFVRGWDIQTMEGSTLAERANQTLYRLLCVIGTVLGVFATLCPTVSH